MYIKVNQNNEVIASSSHPIMGGSVFEVSDDNIDKIVGLWDYDGTQFVKGQRAIDKEQADTQKAIDAKTLDLGSLVQKKAGLVELGSDTTEVDAEIQAKKDEITALQA